MEENSPPTCLRLRGRAWRHDSAPLRRSPKAPAPVAPCLDEVVAQVRGGALATSSCHLKATGYRLPPGTLCQLFPAVPLRIVLTHLPRPWRVRQVLKPPMKARTWKRYPRSSRLQEAQHHGQLLSTSCPLLHQDPSCHNRREHMRPVTRLRLPYRHYLRHRLPRQRHLLLILARMPVWREKWDPRVTSGHCGSNWR